MQDPSSRPLERVGDFALLDRGGFVDAIAVYRATDRSEDRPLEERLWLAEVALYLGDAAQAERLLERPTRPDDSETLRLRHELVRAETEHARGESGLAERTAAPLVEAAAARGETALEMRARYDLGRFARSRGEHTLAIERLAVAARLASEIRTDFYQGLITYNRALSLYALNETAAAERRCVEAIELLSKSEDLRFRALAQGTYGSVLIDLGRFADALDALERAEATAVSLGIARDAASIRGTMARAMIALGRHDEAVSRLGVILEHERITGDRRGELVALNLLTRAELVRRNEAAAERTAVEAVRLAADSESRSDALDARMLAARVRCRLGREGAVEEMRQALDAAHESGTDLQVAEATVSLAEALVDESPIEAEELLLEARRMPVVASTEWLRKELEQVDRTRLQAPIHVTTEGAFVVDVRLGWPQLKSARDALERYIVNRALMATEGNGAAAGRLIGETRYQMHYLKRIFERGEGRPSRARVPSEEAESGVTQRGRRSAARPKRLVRRR